MAEPSASGTPTRPDRRGKRRLDLRVVSPRLRTMRQIKNSPMRRAILRGVTVMTAKRSDTRSRLLFSLVPLVFFSVLRLPSHLARRLFTITLAYAMRGIAVDTT